MSESKPLAALQKTQEALQEIRKQLKPFLLELGVDPAADLTPNEAGNKDKALSELKQSTASKETTIKASMAVALAMGTLRYMGARLRGLDQGRKSDDPLRVELNEMRKLMVSLQKKLDESKKKETAKNKRKSDADAKTDDATPPANKRRKSS